MQAWLERVSPRGPPIRLPDRSGVIIFGRSPKATLVVDDEGVSARHCELTFEEGFWRVRDLGSEGGTRVNGQPVRSRALFAGDLLAFGAATVLKFDTDLPKEDPDWVAAISRDPDLEEPWLVYADQLQERGDPLGERMTRARAGLRLDHQPWMGPLWEPLVQGALEVDWHLGFVRRAVLRTVAGRLPLEWKEAAVNLFNLRVGRFVRELVVDLPRLERLAPEAMPPALDDARRWLAAQPSTPPSLHTVLLGYHLGPETSLELPLGQRLTGRALYWRGPRARLRVVSVRERARLSGFEADGTRALTNGIVRLRRDREGFLHLETPPGMPFLADGNPCYFSVDEGRVDLVAGRMRGEVRVNQRVESRYSLLPGDLIEAQGLATLRFEVG